MNTATALKAYQLMCTAKAMANIYEENKTIIKYVHSTSRGHEAIQLAVGLQLKTYDSVSPYYRDDSLLLALGFTPYELMLQLLAKADDPFSGGRSYYAHPSYKQTDKPLIIHQSSATGMQAIPTTGLAQAIQYFEQTGLLNEKLAHRHYATHQPKPIVVCSLGDNSITEGEVSEAFQFAVLKKLPIIYVVQDNQWGISVTATEARAMSAFEYAKGFKGLHTIEIDGSDFIESHRSMQNIFEQVRIQREPFLVQANVPLLGHHTSGVRKEFYRTPEDLAKHALNDPIPKLEKALQKIGISEKQLQHIQNNATQQVKEDFEKACAAQEPDMASVQEYIFVPTPIAEECGERSPVNNEKVVMVDAALFAVEEILQQNPDAILYGQDVGRRLGGVFREAATLAQKFGDERVFNTAIQEAYIIGSTVGLSAMGVKPIVEVQFADYIYPGLNQLVTEISKSCYLSNGKFNVQTLIRIPVGAYGGGGPYHSGSIESTLLSVKGIKVVYPSNAADMNGLMKAAFYDPNPVVMLEHKGLYWSKVPGTEDAKTILPSKDYMIPLGKARQVIAAESTYMNSGQSCVIVTYGMGVYWSLAAAKHFKGKVEIIDLRTLYPLDEEMIFSAVQAHGKCLIVCEEQQYNSFSEALAARIMQQCFQWLDAPVQVLGALPLPAVPIHIDLEKEMLPTAEKVIKIVAQLLSS